MTGAIQTCTQKQVVSQTGSASQPPNRRMYAHAYPTLLQPLRSNAFLRSLIRFRLMSKSLSPKRDALQWQMLQIQTLAAASKQLSRSSKADVICHTGLRVELALHEPAVCTGATMPECSCGIALTSDTPP